MTVTNPTPPPSDIALTRYVRNECTPLERREIVLWLAADHVNFEHLREVAKHVAGDIPGRTWDADALWSRNFSRSVAVDMKTVLRLAHTPTIGVPIVRRTKRKVRILVATAVAAGVLAAATIFTCHLAAAV